MAAIILAGGKSSRMGYQDKAFLKIGRTSVIKRQLTLLKKYFKKIIVVTNSPSNYKRLRGVTVVSDTIPGCAALGGIFSGLLSSPDNYNFILACDMPFINIPLVKYMYKNSSGYDLVIPRVNNRYEPLFGIYSKQCIRQIKPLLAKKIFKISKLFPRVKIREISKGEIAKFASPKEIFMNINTPDDLSKVII